ncbi:hypothetical protein K501DRAFT_292609 [Backusella circina FSU 941]|nr:hypothetical protein K501DRAFT_292609 [Backusella circina FSU 941]
MSVGTIVKYEALRLQHSNLNFCIHLLLQIMSIIKNQPHLLDDEVNSSEWDFVVKFWGVVTERFGGNTHLTVHDTVSDLPLKVNRRTLHDRVRQRYNVKTDISAFEAAEEKPGNVKYINDRFKVMIESKAVIDRFVLDGCLIDSVNSLQVCGLEIHFGDTTLAESGLYVGNQFYTATIDKSLSNMPKYFNLAFHLLCFRGQCRAIHKLPNDDLIMKQRSARGSWNPPRTSKTPPPPPSNNLFGNDS